MKRKMKNVFVFNINNYFPELTNLTIPTIKAYAEKIGANLNIITERKYLSWPILTEKLQIWELGLNSDWSILFDADILIHPDCPDITENIPLNCVGAKDAYDANKQLQMDKYFIRDGRNIGLSSCCIVTSKLTHDLWKPIIKDAELSKEDVLNNILQDRKIVDEYCISRNMAKYGLKLYPILPIEQYNMIYHLGAFAQDEKEIITCAKLWLEENWKK